MIKNMRFQLNSLSLINVHSVRILYKQTYLPGIFKINGFPRYWLNYLYDIDQAGYKYI